MATPDVPDDTTPEKFTGYFDLDLGIPTSSTVTYTNRKDPKTNEPLPDKTVTYDNKVFEGTKHDGPRKSAPKLSAIYVPKSPPAADAIDVILYLHGHKKDDTEVTHASVWHYLRSSHYKLREEVAAASKKALLVVPSLGEISTSGKLASEPDYYLKYLQIMLDNLAGAGDAKTNPYFASPAKKLSLRNVILACHSGGGSPLLSIVSKATKGDIIRELWLFDALYQDGQAIIDWKLKAAHKLDRVVVRHRKGTAYFSNKVQSGFEDLNNQAARRKKAPVVDMDSKFVDIQQVGELHEDIPATYLKGLIDSSTNLK